MRELSAAEKRELNLDNGLFVANVDGEVARAGLFEGHVILALNDNTVISAKPLQTLFECRADRRATGRPKQYGDLCTTAYEGRLKLNVA